MTTDSLLENNRRYERKMLLISSVLMLVSDVFVIANEGVDLRSVVALAFVLVITQATMLSAMAFGMRNINKSIHYRYVRPAEGQPRQWVRHHYPADPHGFRVRGSGTAMLLSSLLFVVMAFSSSFSDLWRGIACAVAVVLFVIGFCIIITQTERRITQMSEGGEAVDLERKKELK